MILFMLYRQSRKIVTLELEAQRRCHEILKVPQQLEELFGEKIPSDQTHLEGRNTTSAAPGIETCKYARSSSARVRQWALAIAAWPMNAGD